MAPLPQFGSIERAPLIRKFTVLFIIMSLLPFIVISYIFFNFDAQGDMALSKTALMGLVFLTGVGTLAGFIGMRKSLTKIQELSKQARSVMSKTLPGLDMTGIDQNDSEIAQLTRSFSEVNKSLENNIRRLETSKHTMQLVLSKISTGLASTRSIDTFLDLIVEITADALDSELCILMLLDEKGEELVTKAVSGFHEKYSELRLRLGEEAPGWVAKTKKTLMSPRMTSHAPQSQSADLFPLPILCMPLLFQERLIGVFVVAGLFSGDSYQDDQILLVSNLGVQTAVAVENDRLHVDAERTYFETVSALAKAVEFRDPYSRGHSDRVSNYSVRLAEKLGLDETQVKEIKDAAELHDVGKIGIADEILKKYGALDDSEAQIMRKHPLIGEGIVKGVRSLSSLCPLMRCHHEWLDGTGYPDRLKAEQIPFGAKILAVTDSFDAMTTDRPYHKGMDFVQAREELKRYINTRYDEKIVNAFMEVLDELGKK